MKSNTKKRLIAFMLCMVLVLSSATSAFADEQLNKYLLKAKRYSDLERATEDIEYQKKLLKEFGIE